MIFAALTLAGVMAATPNTPTKGPQVPVGALSVPHDFRSLSALDAVASHRITIADALASMDPQTTSAPIGIAVRIVQPVPSCNAPGAEGITYVAQAVNALVVSNAERHGSTPATSYRAANVWGLLTSYALTDWIFYRVTRHAPCPVREIGWGVLGASAMFDATQTEFPK